MGATQTIRKIENRPAAVKGQSYYTATEFTGAPLSIQNVKKLWSVSNQPAFHETSSVAYFPNKLLNWGAELQSSFSLFASLYDNLPKDAYLKNGSTFRYRRFGTFKMDSENPFDPPELLPHRPFCQSSTINQYAGDIQRVFEPLEQAMIDNEFVKVFLVNLFSMIPEQERLKHRFWEVEFHPIRIVGSSTEEGYAAPEGLHTDGHAYLSIFLVNRQNVSGGTSIFADMDKVIFWKDTLLPQDTVLWDDANCFHDVTPILPYDSSQPAIRDVISTSWNPLEKRYSSQG